VELHFFGKAIFDAGVNGPYLLRDLYVSEHLPSADYDAMGPIGRRILAAGVYFRGRNTGKS